MRKRNHGYIMLALLVITGFGSQVYNATITSKERRFLHTELKDTKKGFLESVMGLSANQLQFKPAADKWSVAECIQHIALSEQNLWAVTEKALKQPANPEKRSQIKMTDDEILKMVRDRTVKSKAGESYQPSNAGWTTTEQTLETFKEDRSRLMKYVKTTTQDMRSHLIDDDGSYFDSYQMLLLLSAHSDRHTQQILEVRSHPSFPKQ